MLFSPYSADETRQKLNELKEDLYDRKGDIASEAQDKLKDAVDMGKEFIEEQKGVIGSALEAGKGAYKKEKAKIIKSDA